MKYRNKLIKEAAKKGKSSTPGNRFWNTIKSKVTNELSFTPQAIERLYTICLTAVRRMWDANKALTKDLIKKKPAEESVLVYDKIYRNLLLEASRENAKYSRILKEASEDDKALSSGSAKVIRMTVKGNDIRFSCKNDTLTADDYKRLNDDLKNKIQDLKPGKDHVIHTKSKQLTQGDSKRQSALINKMKTTSLIVKDVANECGISYQDFDVNNDNAEQLLKAAITNIDIRSFMNAIKDQKIKDIDIAAEQINKIIFACIFYNLNHHAEKRNAAAAAKTKVSEARFKEFTEAAWDYQNTLPADQIAKICDLPGTDDIEFPPDLELFDITNHKTGIKLNIDQEIDSDEEIGKFATFLKHTAGQYPISPAAYILIFKAMCGQLNKLAGNDDALETGTNTGACISALGSVAGAVTIAVSTSAAAAAAAASATAIAVTGGMLLAPIAIGAAAGATVSWLKKRSCKRWSYYFTRMDSKSY